MSSRQPAAPSLIRRASLAAEVAVALTVAGLGVRLLPSPRVSRLLGHIAAEGPPIPAPPAASLEARRVGRAVDKVARALPWKPVCLPQAIATRWLLRRRRIPCESHLGVVGTAPLAAHAWVTVAGAIVQGGHEVQATEVARFR
jgi:hypothetical protein